MKVVVLPNVELDILEDAIWWARQHSSEQAWRWMVTVEAQVLAIGDQPESHALADEDPKYPFTLRNALLGTDTPGSHRALFTIVNDIVYVLTVVRSSQGRVDVSRLPRHPFQ